MLSLCALVLIADSKQSTTHSMQYEDAETVHLAGDQGAINRYRVGAVSAEVFSGGRVNVIDEGRDDEHNLYPSFSTDERREWTTIWSGTWALVGGKLSFELAPHSRRCAITKTTSGSAAERRDCGAVSKALRMRCSLAGSRWRCVPDGDGTFDGPRLWVLERNGCVRVVGERFEPCTPPRKGM